MDVRQGLSASRASLRGDRAGGLALQDATAPGCRAALDRAQSGKDASVDRLPVHAAQYILEYMKVLIELDDRSMKELERVAPARRRMRAEFIRRAIRRALDAALEHETESAYRSTPLWSASDASDLEGWDPTNALAAPAQRRHTHNRARRRRK